MQAKRYVLVDKRHIRSQTDLLLQSINTEMAANYAELDRLQQQCNSIRTEMSGGMLAIDQKLQALRNDHEKMTSDVEKLRRDVSDAMAHELEMVIACECL